MYFSKNNYDFTDNLEFKLLLIEYFNSWANIDSFIKTYYWSFLNLKSLKLDSLEFNKNCKNSLFKHNVENWEELMLNKVLYLQLDSNYFI